MSQFSTLRTAVVGVSVVLQPLAAQIDADSASRRTGAVPLATVESRSADEARVSELLGGGPAPSLLRSPSASTPRLCCGVARGAVLMPEAAVVWNSAIPFSLNDGPLWAGRGASARVLAGAVFQAGPLRLIAAPEVVHAANLPFDGYLPPAWLEDPGQGYQPPWQTGAHALDAPYRFGAEALTEVHAGQSSAALHAGPIVVGAASESHWWGPAVRAPIVLGGNAPGFPHLFARSSAPFRTPLGVMEWRWLVGELSGSGHARLGEEGGRGRRSLAAAALALSPAGIEGLTVGAARAVYASADRRGQVPARFADVLRHWSAGHPDGADAEQIVSLFGRWVVPASGAEVYGEWARHALPTSLRDALEMPQHTRGFTLGAQWAARTRGGAVRLQAELTQLEQSPTFRARPLGSYYASARVPHGYTHRGQVLGAPVGPGGSGQWAAADYLGRRGRVGITAGRIRWSTDAFYDSPQRFTRMRGYDVSVFGGARAGVRWGGMDLDGEWLMGKRFNYLFQSRALSWETRDRTVNVLNHTLRFTVTPVASPPRVHAPRSSGGPESDEPPLP